MTHGLDVSYVNWIICGTPVEKIKRIDYVKLIFTPGARFSKVPIINGPGKLSPFTLKIEVSIVLHLT